MEQSEKLLSLMNELFTVHLVPTESLILELNTDEKVTLELLMLDPPVIFDPVISLPAEGIRNQGELDIDCGGPCTACAAEEKPEGIDTSNILIYVIIAIVLMGGMGVVIYEVVKPRGIKHHQKRIKEEPEAKLRNYVKMVMEEGFKKEQVRRRLIKEGWPKEIIENILNEFK